MVRNSGLYSKPAGGSAACDAAIVQENELRSLRRHPRLTRAGQGLPAPCAAVGSCEQQQGIRLADAQAAPAARSRIANIHDEVVGTFDLVEPMTRVRLGTDTPNQLCPPETAQCLYEG